MIELSFKINDKTSDSKQRLIIMFLDDWFSSTLRNTDYIVKISNSIVTISLKYHEDATALFLRGIPQDLTTFVESYSAAEAI